MPEDTQTRTRHDKRAKTYRTTSSSGPLWENVIARITIHDKTGHIMSLEYTQHMNEKEVYWNLPSVRDIPTLLLQCSPVTPNQQLKQSFQSFAVPLVDESRHLTSQSQGIFDRRIVRRISSPTSDCEGLVQFPLFISRES